MVKKRCSICENDQDNASYSVKEMMFGTEEPFEYVECSNCGCLQIETIPDDMSGHYPENYFSFKPLSGLRKSSLRSFIDKHRVKDYLYGGSLIGKIASSFSKPLDYIPWFQHAGTELNSSILDVGCGQGRFLTRLALAGYSDLTGLDPFITNDISYSETFNLYKNDIVSFSESTEKKFDMITMQHSLEHMGDQFGVLQAAEKLLSESGCLLIIVPVADSYVWEHYRESWYQLDSPRHFFLHTKKSMEIACQKSGLQIVRSDNRSSIEQLIGSELYSRGIPGNRKTKVETVINSDVMSQLKETARRVEEKGRGDQTTFFIKRSNA